jgi:hypothetical protein
MQRAQGPTPPASSTAQPDVRAVIRTANRLHANEGRSVVIEGLAVDRAGRACIHLDRMDAIVAVAGRAAWESGLRERPIRARGVLLRHADANDPITGVASLELREAVVEELVVPADGRIRTAPALRAAEGTFVEVEGMAFRSSNGPILVVYGGLAYVRGLPDWDAATVCQIVVVHGTVRHPALPPEAPPAGGSWAIEATGFEIPPSP